jgi:hypothetical protein
MAGHGSPPPDDKANHPGRQVGRHTWQPSGSNLGGIVGTSKHWAPNTAWEDEMSAVEVHPTQGRYQATVSAYNPYERDPRDREAGWHEQDVPFTTRTQLRSQIAGVSLARRLQR